MDSDPEQIELRAPLPDDGLSATVIFLRQGSGQGPRRVPRSEATHAEIDVALLGGRRESRRVTLAEAHDYLEEVSRRQNALEQWERERGVAPPQPATGPRIDCPRCGVPRRYEGRRQDLHEYACPRCGSVELFRGGPLEHPLPGSG